MYVDKTFDCGQQYFDRCMNAYDDALVASRLQSSLVVCRRKERQFEAQQPGCQWSSLLLGGINSIERRASGIECLGFARNKPCPSSDILCSNSSPCR